jgi:D-arabinose 1-dehydrogenase-like Zn-dependent alcohol dehydrogenase
MTTMRAVELPAIGAPLRLVDRPVPEPGPGEVRVRVEACGVCGSDLFLQKGGFGDAVTFPVVPGHEAAGVVDALGEGVTGFSAGDQVAVYYIDWPEGTRYESLGRPNIGPGITRMGVDVDGAFAEYVVRPSKTLIRVPARIDPPALAVLTDAVSTPFHALVRIARLRPGETLAVLGIGGIGSSAVQLGKHLGARVVAVTRSEEKLELARRLGADALVQAGGRDASERARRACGGDGPDVVLQCSGSAAADELAVELAGYAARVVLVGSSPEAFRIRSVDLIWRELQLLGSRGFTVEDIREVVRLFLDGAVTTDHLTAAVRPLEEANDALEDLKAGRVLRSVLVP